MFTEQRARRQIFIFVFCLSFLGSAITLSQSNVKIGIIKSGEFKQYQIAINGFLTGIKRAGISVSPTYYTMGKDSSEAKLSSEIKKENFNLILAVGTEAASFCSRYIKNTPIVFSMVLGPEENNLSNIPNMTGVSLDIPYENHFKTMSDIVPSLSSVGLIYDPTNNEKNVRKAKAASQTQGITLVLEKVYSRSDISRVFNKLISKVDFMWIIPDATVSNAASIKFMIAQTIKNTVPLMGISKNYVKAGALLALVPDYTDIGRQTAEVAAKILSEGLTPSEIEISHPRKNNLILNMRTASSINLDIPSYLVSRAEEVFK